MSTVITIFHFLAFHRLIAASLHPAFQFIALNSIFLGFLFLALGAWIIQRKSSNPVWKGRAGQVRGASVLLLLLTLLTVGCSAGPGGISGCIEEQSLRTAPKVAKEMHGAAQDSSAPLSSTPNLQFQGNRTLLAPPIDSSGSIYGVGLQRQSNCNLAEYILANYNPMTSTFAVNSTVPGYQNVLHSLAMLKTQAGKFSNGCKDSPLGRSSSGAVVLGLTKDGSEYIAAGINPFNNTLLAGTVNLSTGAISQTTVSSVPYPATVATADVNGDGNNDLIVVGLSNTSTLAGAVYVFLSNGDGTFKPPVTYASGQGSDAVAIADVNNDGKLDLVVTGYYQGQTTNGVQVLLGNGDGTFQAAIPSPVVGGYYLATGDFNGDGKEDLALSNGAILLGHGDGTFSAPSFTLPLPGGSIQSAGGLAVGDFNNDGKLDIAINQAGPSVGIFLGKGDGTFTTGKSYAGVSDASDLTVTDLDGDGNLDLLQGIGSSGQYGPSNGTHSGIVNILMGNGDGSFQAAPAYPNTAAPNGLNGPVQAATFATGDFNGDGKPDILAAAVTDNGGLIVSKGLVLLAGDGKGNFTPGSAIGGSSPSVIAAADMNGDGKLDAVFADNLTSVGVAFGNGAGGFQTVVDTPLPNSANIVNLAVGDFNGDGKPDVLVTANGGEVGGSNVIYLLLNKGDGTLEPAVAIDTPTTSPVGLAVGDLNGDGKLDFVVTTASIASASSSTAGEMLVYLGKGDGTFANAVSYGPGFRPSAVAIADMNKDGKPDVIVGSTDQNYTQGTLSVYLGKGDGSLESPQTLTTPDATFTSLAVADINGDGNPDVVMGQNLADVAFGNGDGTLQAPYAIGVGSAPQAVVAADVNGDRRPDLIFVSGNSIDVALNLYGQASTAPAATSTSLSATPNPAAVGQTVTFTAQISPVSGSGVPTGTVTFLNGTTALGTGTLNGSGQATYSTSSLAAGTYSITAVYGGDTNDTGSTSSAVSLTVGTTPPPPPAANFTLTANTGSLSITPGQSGTDTLSVTPENGFNQAVAFACTGLPSEATCSFSPASVTPSGTAAATTTMTIATTAPKTSSRNILPWPFAGGGITLACGLLFISRKKRLRLPRVLSIVLLAGMIGVFMIGCSGGSNSKSGGGNGGGGGTTDSGTPAGTSTVTVTATSGSGASATSHTATVSLTVQ